MTDQNYTAIAVLMDRSGSMDAIRSDAEGALRTFIDDQRDLPGKCTIRLSDFDTVYETVYASTPIAQAPDYRLIPRGGTALLDGIGRLVTEFGEELAQLDEDVRPGKVLVVVQTDGYENSSKEWTRDRIAELIKRQEADYSWKFVFLGANQDAVQSGATMGFSAGSSMTYATSAAGVNNTARNLSRYAGAVRSAASGQAVMDVAFTDDERLASMATDDES